MLAAKSARFRLALLLFSLSLFLVALSYFSRDAGVFINTSISSVVRLAPLPFSNLYPASLLELLIVLSPFLLFFAVLYLLRAGNKASLHKRVKNIFALFLFLASVYLLSLGVGYGIKEEPRRRDFSVDEIIAFADSISAEMSEEYDEELSLTTAAELLQEAYLKLEDERITVFSVAPIPKAMRSSKLASGLRILGNYSFLTAEISVNSEAPPYVRYFSLAHEMAHLFGISDESEANYYAYLALLKSENQTLVRSAMLTAFEYALDELYILSPKEHSRLFLSLSEDARNELLAFSELLKLGDGKLGETSDKVQDTVLGIWNGKKDNYYSDTLLYLMSHYYSKI